MLNLQFLPDRHCLRLLCLGAHSDDIEIGAGATLLRWASEFERLELTWVVMCAAGDRAAEARASVQALLPNAAQVNLVLGDFEDTCLQADFRRAKQFLQSVRGQVNPDLVLTHHHADSHQDHRQLSDLTWQTWRDHLVLEYEVPKYDGDLGRPNLYVPITQAVADTKVAHLLNNFASQRSRDWFTASTFEGLMRLRGVECRAPEGCAEAFHSRKAVL